MMAAEWIGAAGGLLLLLVVSTLAWLGLRGERYRCAQSCGFACPRSGSAAECEMVQDVRIGQWRELRSCSLQRAAGAAPCELDCLRHLNLGLRLDGWRQRSGASWLSPSA
jgi:hypothetical protein